jgi:chemotaxis protein MotB
MALMRRSQRMSASIWPGFVDAMTALLLVLMFVLTIFMVVQGVLRDTISGQETELDQLAAEVTSLSQALGLSQQRTALLEDNLEALQSESNRQTALIANLTGQLDAQAQTLAERDAAIASFEEQVATLLSQRDDARAEGERLTAEVAELEEARRTLITEQEAMQLALARARTEIDAQTEAARLAAAQREALEALTAELRAEAATRETSLAAALAQLEAAEVDQTALSAAEDAAERAQAQLDATEAARLAEAAAAEALRQRLADAEAQLSDEEAARLAELAAAEALRERLENADAELTAMSLALEEQRRKAEETLTLLAAANAVENDLNEKLTNALLALEQTSGNLTESESAAADLETRLATALAERDTARAELTAMRSDLSAAQSQLAEMGATAETRDQRLADLVAERDALRAENDSLRGASLDTASLRDQLAAALAAKIAAENEAAEGMTEAERQATLLSTARRQLADEEAVSTEAQRQVTVLNEQVAALRAELNQLQGLLDSAAAQDAASQIRIEALGSQLNTALARAAAEEKKRAELEAAEAERLRQEAERLKADVATLADYRSEFFGTLRQVLGDREGIQIVGDRFIFSSEVLFESASATLSPSGQEQIGNVASILSDVSDQIPDSIDWIIRVDGHTDNIPISGGEFTDNWELSQARALSVVRYLTEQLGFPPERLAATGFGEYRPVDTADTSEARALNRRIELKLTER